MAYLGLTLLCASNRFPLLLQPPPLAGGERSRLQDGSWWEMLKSFKIPYSLPFPSVLYSKKSYQHLYAQRSSFATAAAQLLDSSWLIAGWRSSTVPCRWTPRCFEMQIYLTQQSIQAWKAYDNVFVVNNNLFPKVRIRICYLRLNYQIIWFLKMDIIKCTLKSIF